MDFFKRPLKPKITLSLSSPLRNAIVKKNRASSERMDEIVYGLMIPIARFNCSYSLGPLIKNNIKDLLNSDKALLYVGHFYFACLDHYAKRKKYDEVIRDTIVHGHIKFCKLYAEAYSTEIPEKEAVRVFLETSEQFKKKPPMLMEEILATILVDNILPPNDSPINLDFPGIVLFIQTWITSYMSIPMEVIDRFQKVIEHMDKKD